MTLSNMKGFRLSEGDLDFLVETASPEATDRWRLKMIVKEDEDFRNTFVGDERVFRRVMDDDDIFLKISPTLFFEILLRKAAKVLEKTKYTLETAGTMKIPVFDARDVVGLLTKESLLIYLADMLSSFTRIESYAITFRARTGVWHKIRFNDLDMQSLMSFCEVVEDEHRLGFYKRIADICLFVLGLFPDYVEREYRYPFSGHLRPPSPGRGRISPEDYEEEGRRFYRLAAEHPSAKEMDLSDVFWALHGSFQQAKKPLNFIAEHYLNSQRHKLFRP
jgi:hypothetical protein